MHNDRTVDKAFKILRRNYSCPGLDGLSFRKIKENYSFHKSAVLEKYKTGAVNTLPIKRVQIVDYGNRYRSIFVYCLYERWLQMYLKLQLEQKVNSIVADYVFGYRPGLDMKMLKEYAKTFSGRYILHIDLEKFFGNIDRKILINHLKTNFGVEDSVLVRVSKSLSRTGRGLPQGNVLSPLLSNIYLSAFDNEFTKNYARFSDDLYFAIDKMGDEDTIIRQLIPKLNRLGLSMNFQKIEVSSAERL